MRENTTPTTTLAIEDNSTINPPNGLIAIAARPEKMPEMPNSVINAITSQEKVLIIVGVINCANGNANDVYLVGRWNASASTDTAGRAVQARN